METLVDLERKGGRTYCGRGSSGGVLRNSGANRSMQRPTVKQRRGLAMMAVLRCEDVARKKKGGKESGKKIMGSSAPIYKMKR